MERAGLNVTALAALSLTIAAAVLSAASTPVRARAGMVVSQNSVASRIGADVLKAGGTAVDAAVATAFALAVVHPTAGNIGGGGFLVYRPASGDSIAYDFREAAPAAATPTMFLRDGKYDADVHHNSYASVGIPGTVAGLHLAWKEHGRLPWKQLVTPAIELARDGFAVTRGLAQSLENILPALQPYEASVAQFTKNGVPYRAGDTLRQPDLARSLERIAERGPAGFYEGETALAVEAEMRAHGGLITREDLRSYAARKRVPVRGSYRGYEVLSMPPPSSGGTVLIEMLNVLEGYDLGKMEFGSGDRIHIMTETMKRAFADRARYLGDPDFIPDMPIARLTSKDYAATLRKTINLNRAAAPSPDTFEWRRESDQTTHLSVVDRNRNAVALTYTLEQGYGAKIVVPGAGFLLNNEMGDFNAGPGLTSPTGLIGTEPNLARPGKRMLSSMAPTILVRNGQLFMVTGSPGGRSIINTVLEIIVNVVDFGMNAQQAVDAGRFHHQWLPDRIEHEWFGLPPATAADLLRRGHQLQVREYQGVAETIVYNAADDVLEGADDGRVPDGAAIGIQ